MANKEMQRAIFSDRERQVIKQFLESGKFTDNMLKFRIKKRYSVIKADFDLVQKAMQKLKDS